MILLILIAIVAVVVDTSKVGLTPALDRILYITEQEDYAPEINTVDENPIEITQEIEKRQENSVSREYVRSILKEMSE